MVLRRSDSGDILQEVLIGFPDRLDVRCKRKSNPGRTERMELLSVLIWGRLQEEQV